MKKSEKESLIKQISCIAEGLGKTFAPFCEVVVHDLTKPESAILSIHNNLSGRKIGDKATELGLARICDPNYPQILPNYANQFSNGKLAKSTSIGIKDSEGNYVAALCLNIDMTLFRNLTNVLSQFSNIEENNVNEDLAPSSSESILQYIDKFAVRYSTTPRALKTAEKKRLLQELHKNGLLNIKKSMETVSNYLGISRASAYGYLR